MSRGLRVEACVLENSLAAVSLARKEDKDEPLSLLFCFEGDEKKPWLGWIEIPRFVTAVSALTSDDGTKEFFRALTNEGDIYVVDYDENPTERIEGAGFFSEDSRALGYCLAMARSGETLFACGNGSQVYVRDRKGQWSAPLTSVDELGDCSFRAISGRSAKDIVVGGFIEPVYDRELTVAGRAHVQRLRELGYLAVLESGGAVRDAEGCLFSYDGKAWKRHPWPKGEVVRDIVELGETRIAIGHLGSVFALGSGKPTLLTNLNMPVRKALALADELYLLGTDEIRVVRVQGKKSASSRSIPLPSDPTVSGTIAVGAGILWYFDTLGVARWIKGKWRRDPFNAECAKALAQLEPRAKPAADKKKITRKTAAARQPVKKNAAPQADAKRKKKPPPKKKRRV